MSACETRCSSFFYICFIHAYFFTLYYYYFFGVVVVVAVVTLCEWCDGWMDGQTDGHAGMEKS
jgi:phosphatidylglycerophosphate synthase